MSRRRMTSRANTSPISTAAGYSEWKTGEATVDRWTWNNLAVVRSGDGFDIALNGTRRHGGAPTRDVGKQLKVDLLEWFGFLVRVPDPLASG